MSETALVTRPELHQLDRNHEHLDWLRSAAVETEEEDQPQQAAECQQLLAQGEAMLARLGAGRQHGRFR